MHSEERKRERVMEGGRERERGREGEREREIEMEGGRETGRAGEKGGSKLARVQERYRKN